MTIEPRDELLHRLLIAMCRGEVRHRECSLWISGRPSTLGEALAVSVILAKKWALMSPLAAGQSLCLLNLTGLAVLSTWNEQTRLLTDAEFTTEDERSLLHLLYEVHSTDKDSTHDNH